MSGQGQKPKAGKKGGPQAKKAPKKEPSKEEKLELSSVKEAKEAAKIPVKAEQKEQKEPFPEPEERKKEASSKDDGKVKDKEDLWKYDVNALLSGTTWENKFKPQAAQKPKPGPQKVEGPVQIDDVLFMEWDEKHPEKHIIQYRNEDLDSKFAAVDNPPPGKFGIFYKNVARGKWFTREELVNFMESHKVNAPTGLLGKTLPQPLLSEIPKPKERPLA